MTGVVDHVHISNKKDFAWPLIQHRQELSVHQFCNHTRDWTDFVCSWRFSPFSAPINWLVHGHMTSNNETLYRQMPWASNIAKTMTPNGKQFTVTHEINVDHCFTWSERAVEGGLMLSLESQRVFQNLLFLFCFGLICLVKKRKIHFRILSDLRIQSWIFLKKRTLSVNCLSVI